MSSSSTQPPIPDSGVGISRSQFLRRGLAAGVTIAGAGTLADGALGATKPHLAPHLPAGFSDTFASRYIEANGLRQHAIIGGDGPPLLLIHGWPQNWYQYRFLMPALARDFQVIAVDQRGMGLSGKPRDGYDNLSGDLIALMDALGHQRFAVVGCDTGMGIGYALAADHPDRIDRLVVGEAVIPGVTPSPPLFVPGPIVGHVWHLLFNRLAHENEDLVRGREASFFGFIYAIEAGNKLPDYAVKYYTQGFAASRDALRGSFELYRVWDVTTAQNQQRAKQRLTLPVLAIGGELGLAQSPEEAMKLVADDVQGLVIPNCGHWLAEEAPAQMLAALSPFLAPYKQGS